MRTIRVLRECRMSNSLMLNQHRIAASKKLGDILRTLQWGDGVNLSWCVVTGFGQNSRGQKVTDRVSNDQDAVAQFLSLEDRQVFDGTNGPLGS